MADPVYYINRETGCREREIIYGEKELELLYQNPLGQACRKLFANRSWFSQLNSLNKKSWLSKEKIPEFIRRYKVELAEIEKPLQSYTSLDDFFTRRLKASMRPICTTAGTLVSPADGRAQAFPIDFNSSLRIKSQTVALSEFLNDRHTATQLNGGWALVVRLAPRDYHRFHFPADGLVTPAKRLPGKLESVHPIALAAGARSFANKRCSTHLESREFGALYMVEVGALTVGTIIQSYQPGEVRRGQEKGYFRFGGSTVVLLWGRNGPAVDSDIVANSQKGIETLVKFGSRIAAL